MVPETNAQAIDDVESAFSLDGENAVIDANEAPG